MTAFRAEWDAFVLASARGTLQWGRVCPENGPCRGQWAYIGVGDDKLSVVCLQAVRALETQTTHYPEGGTDTSQQGEAWRGLAPCVSRVPGSLRLTPCWQPSFLPLSICPPCPGPLSHSLLWGVSLWAF